MTTNFISYSEAVKRFNNSLILCNNIAEIDPSIFDNIRIVMGLSDYMSVYVEVYKLNDRGAYECIYTRL